MPTTDRTFRRFETTTLHAATSVQYVQLGRTVRLTTTDDCHQIVALLSLSVV